MKTILHKANERGHASHGWLDSWHSFSFSEYYNPSKMQFGALRVLNDDYIQAGYGFPKHPHSNMEIVTIPLYGDLEHKDSTGRHAIIRQNDVQIMSAGRGIQHSEMNPNRDKEVNLLQIWVFPKQEDIEPRYQQKTFTPETRKNNLLTVVAPDDEQAVWINQDAWFSLVTAGKGFTTDYTIRKQGNGVYVFVITGTVSVNGTQLEQRDALGVWDTNRFTLTAGTDAEVLLIDIPMQAGA